MVYGVVCHKPVLHHARWHFHQPFLHSLEISLSVTALVWLSEPLCCVVFQPVFEALSNSSTHRWGRRRPFIFCGASSVIFCLLALTCTEDLTGDYIGTERVPGQYIDRTKKNTHIPTQLLATFWILALNISVQSLRVGVRGFTADHCPGDQQAEVISWGNQWSALGSVFITLAGSLEATNWVDWVEKSNFKCLGLIVGCSVAVTAIVVCVCIEDKPHYDDGNKSSLAMIRNHFTRVWRSSRNMSSSYQQLCRVQFAAWLGWFPVLYYMSS